MDNWKGVICAVREDHEMPHDDFGNRADMAIYEKSVIARMNLAQLYEVFINAASRDVSKDVAILMAGGQTDDAWAHLLRYYEVAAPETYAHAVLLTDEEKVQLLASVQRCGVYLKCSAADTNLTLDIYRKIMEYRAPDMSQLTYVPVGTTTPIRTDRPMLIGEKYINVLEKSDFKPSGVCGVLRQHHGCAAVENKNTKHTNPSKEQPPRLTGETEGRAGSAVFGGEVITDMMDYVNNPNAHKEVVRKIFTAEKPSAIYNLVDRQKIPRGRRPLLFVKHIGECAGWELSNQPHRGNNE